MTLRAVLFDATGVLIETAEPVGRTYARTARDHGVALPEWRLDDAFRRVLRRAPPRVFPGLARDAVPRAELDWWRERVREIFQAADSTVRFADFAAFFADLFARFASPRAWRARPGAEDALRRLRGAGLATGVVSNFDHRLPAILAGLGLGPLLDVVVVPATCGAAKPARESFLAALAVLGVGAAEAVFVGHDPEQDLAGAAAAGLRVLELAEPPDLASLPARVERLATLAA
jgi:putative hydrolase of the HAD superfamily